MEEYGGMDSMGQAEALSADPCNDHEMKALHKRLVEAGAAAAQPKGFGSEESVDVAVLEPDMSGVPVVEEDPY